MPKLLIVARREYLERVRSKAFIISTVLGPLIMGALIFLPGLLMQRQRGKPLRVSVLDESGKLASQVEAGLREQQRDNGTPRFAVTPLVVAELQDRRTALREQVVQGGLDAYLVLPADAVGSSAIEYYGKNVSNFDDIHRVEKVVEDAIVGQRLTGAGLQPERVRDLTRKPDVKTIQVSARGLRQETGGTAFILSFMLVSLLYTSLAIWGAAIMNGVIEEKMNRVVEVMASSVPATQLFAGKLLGVGAAGLTQFLAWALTLGALSLYGAAWAAASGTPLPELRPAALGWFVLLFLLGYFIYGALYASVGAAVNTTQEAQSLAFPVMMPLMTAFVFAPQVISNPDSPLSVVLSLIPFLTPLLMFLRVNTVTPPAWQLALAVGLSLATIVLLNWAAARIYRVGILMYGKKPTLPQILRWVRAS
jgi:ABC-2 type transport system permease protein